jgi:hypothetical protein
VICPQEALRAIFEFFNRITTKETRLGRDFKPYLVCFVLRSFLLRVSDAPHEVEGG